jgi:hypothetical protein
MVVTRAGAEAAVAVCAPHCQCTGSDRLCGRRACEYPVRCCDHVQHLPQTVYATLVMVVSAVYPAAVVVTAWWQCSS